MPSLTHRPCRVAGGGFHPKRLFAVLATAAATLAVAVTAAVLLRSENELPGPDAHGDRTTEVPDADGAPTGSVVTAASSPPVGGSPAGLGNPYKIEECELLSKNYGNWTPTVEEMAAAAAKVSTRLCAGYWEHDPRRVAASVRQCASIAGAATVGFMVPQPEGGCTVQFRSVSWKDRKWVRVRSDYARGGQFGSIIDILEMRGQSFDDYASTWQCQLDWERAVRGDDLPQETGDATRLRAEWKNFPASLRGFLCTAEHIGENLGAPAPDE